MNIQILSLIICSVGLFIGVFGKNERIIGGQETHISRFPYMASIRLLSINQHFCGGVIISNWHILTVAHSFYKREVLFNNMGIYTGTTSSTNPLGKMSRIRRVHIHVNYEQSNRFVHGNHNDIAVITLTEPLEFNRFQQKIELPVVNIEIGDEATIVGWGSTDMYSMSPSEGLRYATMKIYSNTECQASLNIPLHDEHVCAFENQSVGNCVGDTGGPLIVNGRIAGISSFVLPCGRGFPDVYTNVYKYKNYIESIIL